MKARIELLTKHKFIRIRYTSITVTSFTSITFRDGRSWRPAVGSTHRNAITGSENIMFPLASGVIFTKYWITMFHKLDLPLKVKSTFCKT